jgi:hypothetical protein
LEKSVRFAREEVENENASTATDHAWMIDTLEQGQHGKHRKMCVIWRGIMGRVINQVTIKRYMRLSSVKFP